jgi:hypothetical protein
MLADIAHFEGRLVDWKELETYLQSTPFRAIEYDSPDRRLKTILGG